MTNSLFQSTTCRFGILLFLAVSFSCQKEKDTLLTSKSKPSSPSIDDHSLQREAVLLTQTKTATYLNNLNNFQQVFVNAYPGASASYVAADDNIFASSYKLSAKGRSYASLALQGFGFTIPGGATIQNIAVKVRRFKSGTPSIGDYFLSVMQRYQCGMGTPCTYGVAWTYQDTYAGKTYPNSETEYVFSQNGSGNNGGFNHSETYQWTPAMVNHQYFGVRIDVTPPVGNGTVTVYYDLVTVTVQYSL